MNTSQNTLKLLVLEHSQNEAEQLVSLLRNAGILTRAQHVDTCSAALQALEQQPWDIVIAELQSAEDTSQIAPIIEHIRDQDKDVAVIASLIDFGSEHIAQLLKTGLSDVVPADQEQHLVAVVKREFNHRLDRQRLRLLEIQIRAVEHRCELLLDNAHDPIAYISDGMHIYANAAYLAFLGYEDIDELMCVPVLDTFDGDSQETFKRLSKQFYEQDKFEDIADIQCISVKECGNTAPVFMGLSEASYDGERCLQVVLRDQSELDASSSQNTHVDPNTGLFNRQHLMAELNQAKDEAIHNETGFALYYIAIDQFQMVKTELGIDNADLLLAKVASFIADLHPDIPAQQYARVSDEVIGLLAPCASEDDARQYGHAICKATAEHLFDIDERSIELSLTIGVALINDNAPSVKEILARAQHATDNLHQHDNQQAEHAIAVFQNKQEQNLNDQESAINTIQHALDEDQFKLLFQPIISLRGEGEEHYEAFVRMLNDHGEEISPYDFLPPTGPSQMASKIDKWVILQTIKHLAEHRSQGHDTHLFINLCAETLLDENFGSWLNVALKSARLPGDSLIFQVSESNAISHMKQTIDFERSLKELNCRLSINQFGRALQPFNLFKHISPDYIKLEGSFTEDIQKGSEAKKQAQEMIEQLQNHGNKIIVPLVESASLLSTLWQAGVNYIQGYYLQAPSAEMNYDFDEDS